MDNINMIDLLPTTHLQARVLRLLAIRSRSHQMYYLGDLTHAEFCSMAMDLIRKGWKIEVIKKPTGQVDYIIDASQVLLARRMADYYSAAFESLHKEYKADQSRKPAAATSDPFQRGLARLISTEIKR